MLVANIMLIQLNADDYWKGLWTHFMPRGLLAVRIQVIKWHEIFFGASLGVIDCLRSLFRPTVLNESKNQKANFTRPVLE